MYLIDENEFNQSISLRVEEPNGENRRINWAKDFDFDRRWPPHLDAKETPVSERETISRVIEKLQSEDIPVAKPVGSKRYELIIQEEDRTLRRMRVKTGWLDKGRIRYQYESIPDWIDFLAVFLPPSDNLYIVPREAFDSSIVLRVDEPKKRDSRINWAEDYEFPKNIPW